MVPLMRICILGVPKAGKTTLASNLARDQRAPVRHTDSLIDTHSWSDASTEAATWLDEERPWIVEGVAVGRALRKWLAAHPTGKPCDFAIWMGEPRMKLSPGQETMARGCETVWREIAPELRRRGVDLRVA